MFFLSNFSVAQEELQWYSLLGKSVQEGSTAGPVDSAHPGIGDLGSVTKITPWDHSRDALIPFPLKKSMLARKRDQELLEVLVSMSQLSSGS